MSHNLIRLQLSAYVDDELSAQEAEDVRNHLAQCEDCRKTADDYRSLRGEIKTGASVDLPPNFAMNVFRAARRQNDPQVVWSVANLFARRLVLALTVVVFFVVSVGSLNSSEPQVEIEPGFSAVSIDSTVQKTLLQGKVSEEDILLAVIDR